LFRFYLNHPWW